MDRSNLFYRSFYAMGTRFELVIPGAVSPGREELSRRVERAVRWWEERLSRFREESDLSRINREGARHPVAVDEQVFTLLEECARYHTMTAGLFDPAILALQRRWENNTPGEEEAMTSCGWDQVVLDKTTGRVSLRTAGAGLDPGAFGKGVALREIQKILRTAGVEDALVSFGGSSITALGHHPHGPHWPVGIPNIFNPTENVYLFEMKDTSLSTSGVSAQRLPRGPEGYLHVLNPLTGLPVRGWKSVSVKHPDALTAEVLSTAFLAAEKEQQEILHKNFPEAGIIRVQYDGRKANIFTFGS